MYKSEVIFSDKIGKFVWYPEIKAMLHTYYEESADATDEEFLHHIHNLDNYIRQYKPLGLIEDYQTIRYVTSPEMQRKIVGIVKPTLTEIKLKRYAKLVSEDLLSQLLSEQIVDEARRVSSYVILDKDFSKLQDALDWIAELSH